MLKSFDRFGVLSMKTFYFKYQLFVSICLSVLFFMTLAENTNAQYKLIINRVDKDTSNDQNTLSDRVLRSLPNTFANKTACTDFIYKLSSLLTAKGYASASVDSVYMDAVVSKINLYLGKPYLWARINTDKIDRRILLETGWNDMHYRNKKLDLSELQIQEQRMLTWHENNGYPFATVNLDSIRYEVLNVSDVGVIADLVINKGPLYHIDSIRVFGKAKLRNQFLQRYLNIPAGSIYSKSKLMNINKRIIELPFLQQQQRWDISMLGTGSVLNLYLAPKRNSEINFLIGFLPPANADSKAQLTGDVNLNLKNSLGSAETIFLNWQQLQRQSPKLNLGYQQPFIFNSPFGIDFSFNLLKRDSTYLQINGQLGIQYLLSANQSGKVFVQNQRTFLLPGGVDTNLIKATKKLPANIDVNSSSIGIEYEWVNTNYKYNPRTGNEFNIITSVGLKKISRNNDITSLKDPFAPSYSFNSLYDSLKLSSYQVRFKLSAAHYFPVGKRSAFKSGLNAGVFQSQNTFRNELFQIGGYKLLRGFNEESIYASQYAVLTEELRFLTGINSYLYFFSDLGATRTHFQSTNFNNTFISAGIGLALETKIGLLNFSIAEGKRNDIKFDLREASKFHFGYVNYF